MDRVHGQLTSKRDVTVLNMSLTGLAAESTVPLQIGQTTHLEMVGDHAVIDVEVEVRWSNLVDLRPTAAGVMQNIYHAGLDFSADVDEKAQEMLSFIGGHVIVDVERKLTGQFRGSTIQLDSEHDFLVRNIGFSGMWIHTRVPYPPRQDSILEVELQDEVLPLECAARVAEVRQREQSDGEHSIRLEFQDLSLDNGLALDYFIRNVLE